MSSEHSEIIPPTEANSVWAERTGTRQYLGRNARGAQVCVGTGPGEFTPGELIKLALGTCNTLSADHRLAKALGDDFEANVIVATLKNEEECYTDFDVQIIAELSSLSAEQRSTLAARVEAAIERACTVGHTIEKGAGVRLHLLDDQD